MEIFSCLNTCLERKKQYKLVPETPKNTGYRIQYEKDKYVAIPLTIELEFPTILLSIKKCHVEKFKYRQWEIPNKYGKRAKYTLGWFEEKYELLSDEYLKELADDILIILNAVYLKCKGCNKEFDQLAACMKHKETCSLLLNQTEIEEKIVKYMKFESRDKRITIAVLDNEKEIIYLCHNGEFKIMSIPFVCINKVVLISRVYESYQFKINQYVLETREKEQGYDFLKFMNIDTNDKTKYTETHNSGQSPVSMFLKKEYEKFHKNSIVK